MALSGEVSVSEMTLSSHRHLLHQVELSAQDSNRSRSRKYLGIGPATEQDWPNCGQQEETCPRRQLGGQTKYERSTQDLSKTGGNMGLDSKMPGCQLSQERIDPVQSLPGNQPVIIRQFEQSESQD